MVRWMEGRMHGFKFGPNAHYRFSGSLEVFLLDANSCTKLVLVVLRKKKDSHGKYFSQICQETTSLDLEFTSTTAEILQSLYFAAL